MTTDESSPKRLPELTFNLRYHYVVTRVVIRRGARVALTVYADGESIGYRETMHPYLYAQVCSVDPAAEITDLLRRIQVLLQEADFADRVQRRDPAALAKHELTQRHRYGDRASYLACRENAIQAGEFAVVAQHHREEALLCRRQLDRLISGQLEECNLLCVPQWQRFWRMFPRVPSEFKLLDILEVPTGMP